MTQKLDVPALQTQVVLEAQWSDLPLEAVDEIRELWQQAELGNDTSYYTYTVGEFEDEDAWLTPMPNVDAYLVAHGVDTVLIHWWW